MKGFTLIEMLAAAVILSFIILIIVPLVTKTVDTARDKAYRSQIDKIEYAARNWGAENIPLMPKTGESITIYLWVLKEENFINKSFVNQKTEKEFFDDMQIVIDNTTTGYVYTVLEDSGSKYIPRTTAMPVVIMKSGPLEKVKLDTEFNERGLIVIDENEQFLSSYVTKYYIGINEVPEIDTSVARYYDVKYTITYNTYVIEIERVVQVINPMK